MEKTFNLGHFVKGNVEMKLLFWRILICAVSVLVLTLADHHDTHDNEAKDPHKEDISAEIEAAKNPIVSHLLILLSTMYKGISCYKMIPGPLGEEHPSFCHKYECPKFTVLCKNLFYEVRKYGRSKFIATSVPSDSVQDPAVVGFKLLYEYLSGQNSKGVKIKLTRPLAVQTKYPKIGADNTSSTGVKHKEIYVHLPAEFQNDPPAPTNPEVRIIEAPETVVYVKMFGGIVLRQLWSPKKARFFKVLEAFNQTVDPNYRALSVVYDKPSALLHRHNEIFYLASETKENQKYCTAK